MRNSIENRMMSLKNEAQTAALSRFFKTGPGQYGEGDLFLGIKVPQTRLVVKECWKDCSMEELDRLIASPYHEIRLCALLILVQKYHRDKKNRQTYVDYYLSHTQYINNWDLVDLSCTEILGDWTFDKDRSLLFELSEHENNFWEQRMAIVSTLYWVRHDDFDDALLIADRLLHHPNDLIQKAVGWTLREVGKHDSRRLHSFLRHRYKKMPRTCLRYAIEKFRPEIREAYLQGTLPDYDLLTQKLPLVSIDNPRDLGGYRLPDGSEIRHGLLLRGGSLANASEEDLEYLKKRMSLSQIFDFRTEGEVRHAPDLGVTGCRHLWLPTINPDTESMALAALPHEAYADLMTWLTNHAHEEHVQEVARVMYTEMVSNEYTQLQYAAFLNTIIKTEKGGVYWHCSQGKDRTGLGAAFLLAALGADIDLIMKDFSLSNEYYRDVVAEAQSRVKTEGEKTAIQTFMGVNPVYFRHALQWIEDHYGSLINYVHEALLLDENDIRILKERYLIPAKG